MPLFEYCFKASTILHFTFYILHLEETRSTSRLKKQGSRKSQRSEIFGKRRSRLAGRTFCHWQNVDSIGERRRAQGDRRRRPAPARPAARDDRKEGERPSSVGCAATFPQGGRQELAPPVIPIEGVQPPLCHPERAKRAEGSLKTILAQAKSHFCASAPNLRSSARAGKVKPRHFYSKQFSKNGKITLLPFFPYGHTDGGECGAILIKACP